MTRRFLPLLLGVLALALGLLAGVTPATADTTTNEVGACLADGDVWLLVITDEHELLANECVGTPATGTEALTTAELTLRRQGASYICSIGGYPEVCPLTYAGQYWNYYNGTPGQPYAYSALGADSATPDPGTVEAWCYNSVDETSCTPPYLRIVQDGQEAAVPEGATALDLPTGQAARGTVIASLLPSDDSLAAQAARIGIPAAALVIALAAVAIVLRRRRPGRADAPR